MPKKTFFSLLEEKRKRVTQVLIKYFAHYPYNKVDIEDVAKESQVSKGSMYQYFENKKDMYFFAISEAFARYMKIAEGVNFEKTSFFDYIKKGLEFYSKFLLKDTNACLLIEKSALHDDSPFREEIEEMYHEKTREILKDIILKNQKAGFIRKDVDADLLVVFIEGASWNFKKALLRVAEEKGIPLSQLPKKFIKKVQNSFLKLLKEGIEFRQKKIK